MIECCSLVSFPFPFPISHNTPFVQVKISSSNKAVYSAMSRFLGTLDQSGNKGVVVDARLVKRLLVLVVRPRRLARIMVVS